MINMESMSCESKRESGTYEIIREGSRNYLSIESTGEDFAGEAEWEQFQVLAIRGFLTCRAHYRDGRKYIRYEVTGKKSLRQCYGKRLMGYETLCGLLLSLDRILKEIHEFLLSEDCLLLEPESVYESVNGKEWFYVYAPGPEGGFGEQIRIFAEYLLEVIDHEDDNNVRLAYQFYKYAAVEHFSMEEFLTENKEYINAGQKKTESVQEDTAQTLICHDTAKEEPEKERDANREEQKGRKEQRYYDIYIRKEREEEYEKDYEKMQKAEKEQHPRNSKLSVIFLGIPLLILAVSRWYLTYDINVIIGIVVAYIAGIIIFCFNKRKQEEYRKKEKQLYMENRMKQEE